MSAFEKLAVGFTGGLKRAFQLPARLVQGVREMAEAVKNPYCETMMEESFNADGSNAPLAMLQPTGAGNPNPATVRPQLPHHQSSNDYSPIRYN